jgi:predicted MFS family arabinose efflux permease
MTSERKSVWAIFIVFFLESAVLGNWIPRIPDLKQQLGLTDGSLGLCLLAIPLGTFIGLIVAGKMIEHTGLRRACQISLPAWAISFVFPPLAPNPIVFVIFLFIAGVAVGMIEVAMNTEADRIEQHIKKRIMSRCHGFWSLGSMAGALMGGALAQVGLSVAVHFAIVMPILALIGWWTASQLPRVASVTASHEDAPLFRLPTRAIILLCLLPMGAMVVEGAFIDWSGVFMRSIMDASPLVISITYSFFAIVMATVRLCGDAIGERVAARTIVQCSGVASAVGIAVFALAPNLVVAYIGAAISGIGVAIVYPLAVTAAARRPGRSAADNVAAITMISFTAFMIAPPVIGFLSEAFGLRIALLMLAPVALTTALLSHEVPDRQ